MNDHHLDIIKHLHLEKPVAKLFNSPGHSLEDLSIFIKEKIHVQRKEDTFDKMK